MRPWLFVAFVATTARAGPAPDEITLATKGGANLAVGGPLDAETRIQLGDLVAVEATPRDHGGDAMKLCLEVTSSAPEVVEVRRAAGACDEPRVFVLAAKKEGTSRVRFGARGTWREVAVIVSP